MPDESTQSPIKRALLISAKLGVSIALLVLLFTRVDGAEVWAAARKASIVWLLIALGIYAVNMLASAWRWHLLLSAQQVPVAGKTLFGSLLVAAFFNNFLPSNIGGDVIRIRDTAPAARSKTLATTIVLVDRGLGLMALILISALGATMAAQLHGIGAAPIWPMWLWSIFIGAAALVAPAVYAPSGVGRLLRPLTVLHPEWIGTRIDLTIETLARFRDRPSAMVGCFGGAILVQGLVVIFYAAVAHALQVPITTWDLLSIVPLSVVVQMLPISLNGFGVREATFSLYFARIGLPIASGVVLSLVAAALIMFFSLSGAIVYISRGR